MTCQTNSTQRNRFVAEKNEEKNMLQTEKNACFWQDMYSFSDI